MMTPVHSLLEIQNLHRLSQATIGYVADDLADDVTKQVYFGPFS